MKLAVRIICGFTTCLCFALVILAIKQREWFLVVKYFLIGLSQAAFAVIAGGN